MDGLDSRESVYKQFYSYDFDSDTDYQNGLQQVYQQYLVMQSDSDLEIKKDLSNGIFDSSKIKAKDLEMLQLQAKIFFFCSQTGNILEIDDYQKWLKTKKESLKHDITEEEDLPYSSNYEQLVDLIVNNKPVPGIKQIPKTLLDPETADESSLQPRRKPWEKKEEKAADNDVEVNSSSTNTQEDSTE